MWRHTKSAVPYDAHGQLWRDALHLSLRHFDHQGRRRGDEARSAEVSARGIEAWGTSRSDDARAEEDGPLRRAEQHIALLQAELRRAERDVALLLRHVRLLTAAMRLFRSHAL